MKSRSRLIPLNRRKFAIVSADDYEFLTQWEWKTARAITKRGEIWYAVRSIRKTVNGKRVSAIILMHREVAIMSGLPKAREYDHRDRNGLNNQRDNIRACSRSQNCANRNGWGISGVKGVSFHNGNWRSRIRFNGKEIYLGGFKNPSDAHRAYYTAAVKLFGEFASPD